jgi:hypothetical protein
MFEGKRLRWLALAYERFHKIGNLGAVPNVFPARCVTRPGYRVPTRSAIASPFGDHEVVVGSVTGHQLAHGT